MTRERKIITALQVEDIANPQKAIGEIENAFDNSVKNKDVAQQGDTKPAMDLDFLNNRNLTEQSGREMFGIGGLDPTTYEYYRLQLQKLGMKTRQEQAEFLQEVAGAAMMGMSTIQKVFPVAYAAFNRNISSPERALAVVKLIAEEQSKLPGMDLFAIANKAATGNAAEAHAELQAVRFAIAGQSGNLQEATQTMRRLEQAMLGFVLPSSELGKILHQDNFKLNKLEQLKELFLTKAALFRIEADIKAKQYLANVYKDWIKNMPQLVNNPVIRRILQKLQADAINTMYWQSVGDAMGYEGGQGLNRIHPGAANNAPLGLLNQGPHVPHRRSMTPLDRIVLAGGQGQAPTDLRGAPQAQQPTQSVTPGMPGQSPGNPQPTTTPQQPPNSLEQAYRTTEQANFGNDPKNEAAFLIQSFGAINQGLANQLSAVENAIGNSFEAVKQNYEVLKQLVTEGDGAVFNTKFLQDANSSSGGTAPYATPDQIEQEGIRISQQAKAVHELLRQEIAIVQKMSAAGQQALSQMHPSVQSAVAKFQSLLRAKVAEVRQISIHALDIAVLGPIEQEVRVLSSYYDYYKGQIDFGNAALMGVGIDVYVYPFMQVLRSMSQKLEEAVQKYRQAASKFAGKDAAMAQYCSTRAQQIHNSATKAMTEGLTEVAKMANKGGQFQMAQSEEIREIRLAVALHETSKQIEPVEAKPESVEDYWNKLYNNDPEYGTLIEDAPLHHDETTKEVHKRKHKIRRKL